MARPSWSDRYVGISLVLIGLCFPAIWFYVGYRELSLNEMLSFRIDDGWCVKGVESIGRHCFGDYASTDDVMRSRDFWNPDLPTATAYPPLSMVPPIAFVYLGQITGSWALGRDLFMILLAGSLLAPALWVSRRGWAERAPTALLIIGVATTPFLVVLDRGNTTGLLVAPLLGVATAYMNERHERMAIFIVICALLKPQMLLLALLFLVYRRYAHLVLTVGASAALTLAGFLVFPGSYFENVTNWLHLILGYQGYQPLSNPYPYNLGIARSALTVFELSHLESLAGSTARSGFISWLQLNSILLSAFPILLTIAMMFLRRRDSNLLYPLFAVCILIIIVGQTSYSYYLALLLVPAAFILRDPRPDRPPHRPTARWSGMLDSDDINDSRWGRFARWLLILGLALLLMPIVIPITSVPKMRSLVETTEALGAVQLLWGPILIVLFLLTVAMALSRPTRWQPACGASEAVARPTASAKGNPGHDGLETTAAALSGE